MRQTSRYVQNRALRKKIRQFYSEQFKSRKFDRVRNEEECVKTLASLEQTLLAMRCHLEVGHDLLAVYGCLGATYIGGGLTAKSVLPVLDVYRVKVNELLKSVMFDGSRRALPDLQGQVDAVRDDLKMFVGQAMVLPLSLEVFADAKVRDCRVVIDYGGKLTTIHGTHFSGRCSRILLDLHPGNEPKISLAYRKTVMGIFIKEKIVGQAKHNRILGGAESPGCFNVELLFTEDQVGRRVITARACLQVEWFPKPASHCHVS